MSSFVYLLTADLSPLFLRTAKSAPPMTKPPNTAMITMASTYTSQLDFSGTIDTRRMRKVPISHLFQSATLVPFTKGEHW